MNITQETNDYFSTTEGSKYLTEMTQDLNDTNFRIGKCIPGNNSYYAGVDPYPTEKQMLRDKLKTTPDPAIKKIKCNFIVDWNKLFKKK